MRGVENEEELGKHTLGRERGGVESGSSLICITFGFIALTKVEI